MLHNEGEAPALASTASMSADVVTLAKLASTQPPPPALAHTVVQLALGTVDKTQATDEDDSGAQEPAVTAWPGGHA